MNNTLTKEDDDLKFFNESTQNIVLLSKKSRNTQLRITTECLHTNTIAWMCKDITQLKTSEIIKMDAEKLLDQERGLTEWLSHKICNPLSIAQEAVKFLMASEYSTCRGNHNCDHHDCTLKNECKENTSTNDTHSLANLVNEAISHVVDLLNNMLDLEKLSASKIQL